MNIQKKRFSTSNNFLLILLAIDFGFILLHFYNSVLIPDSEYKTIFSIVEDTSLAEKFQYLKWISIAGLFFYITLKRAYTHYIPWALIFIYLFLDDSLTLHERVGAYLVQDFTGIAPFNLRWQDIGELLVSAIAGSVLFTLLGLAYLKGNRLFKKVTVDMLILFSVLVLLGIGIDMLSQMVDLGRYGTFIFEIIEDGGEMFIASVIFWYAFIVAKLNKGGVMGYLQDFFFSFYPARI